MRKSLWLLPLHAQTVEPNLFKFRNAIPDTVGCRAQLVPILIHLNAESKETDIQPQIARPVVTADADADLISERSIRKLRG